MMKRSFLLAAAAGLVASIAFATPSHAAGTIVTTNVSYGSPTNTVALTDIDIFYAGAGTISGSPTFNGFAFNSSSVTFPPVTIISIANGWDVHIAAGATLLTGSFKFNSSTDYAIAPSTITVSSVSTLPTGHAGQVTTALAFNIGASSIPEPSSVALLGIGMTGFLAFRRLFKRTPVA
jgi:hypothetical protein